MSKDLVSKWFTKISPVEQNMPLLVLNGLAYTPRQAYDEVMRGTLIGDQLQNLIETGRFGTAVEDEKALIKMRLRMSLQSKPQDKPLFVALPTSGVQPKVFSPAQLLEEIESGTAIGQQWINNEANYMRRILQVR